LTLRTFHLGGSASGSSVTGTGKHQDITSAVSQLTKLLSNFIPELKTWRTASYVTGLDASVSLRKCVTRDRCMAGMAELVRAVHAIYKDNKVELHPKHVELVVREIFFKVVVSVGGDTGLAAGAVLPRAAFDAANDQIAASGLRPATGRLLAYGISSQKLHADRPLVAASFGAAFMHLAAAAVKGQAESITTMRERVMVGGLIQAGTGFQA
jgi:hypothetical protein